MKSGVGVHGRPRHVEAAREKKSSQVAGLSTPATGARSARSPYQTGDVDARSRRASAAEARRPRPDVVVERRPLEEARGDVGGAGARDDDVWRPMCGFYGVSSRTVFAPPARPSQTAASLPRNDLVKNCRVHPTHWLFPTAATRRSPRSRASRAPGHAVGQVKKGWPGMPGPARQPARLAQRRHRLHEPRRTCPPGRAAATGGDERRAGLEHAAPRGRPRRRA